jgi:excisionase family DNA binding protein
MDARGRALEKSAVLAEKTSKSRFTFFRAALKACSRLRPRQRDPLRILATMQHPKLYSIQEARKVLGGSSRNTIYQLLRSGELPSVVIGCRRFISAAAITELIARSTTTLSPARASTRSRRQRQGDLPFPYHRPLAVAANEQPIEVLGRDRTRN